MHAYRVASRWELKFLQIRWCTSNFYPDSLTYIVPLLFYGQTYISQSAF